MDMLRAGNRSIEWCSDGLDDGPLVIYFHGTPIGMRLEGQFADALLTAGARLVGFSRAGYRQSTRQPGRTIADVAEDVSAIIEHLGRDEFWTIGWSGGGPHALAAAALVPGCNRVAVVAGLAPLPGFDWRAGMSDSGIAENEHAIDGEASLREELDPATPVLAAITGDMMLADPSDLFSPGDLDAMRRPGEADAMAASMRSSMEFGNDGYVDDSIAFVNDWGFELSKVVAPVTIWQGEDDRMVPAGHGRRLAELLPDATLRLLPGDGHISVMLNHGPEVAKALLG